MINFNKRKPIWGIGINDADYPVILHANVPDHLTNKLKRVKVWRCPYYQSWTKMLERCYSKKYLLKYPSYDGCMVCREWHLFSNFRKWMEQQDWKDKELDKDLLVEGNKVYSPETCAFIAGEVNRFILEPCNKSGLPLGVTFHKKANKYMAQAAGFVGVGRQGYIGLFNTPEEAHEAWKLAKRKLAEVLADKQADARVQKALLERY